MNNIIRSRWNNFAGTEYYRRTSAIRIISNLQKLLKIFP